MDLNSFIDKVNHEKESSSGSVVNKTNFLVDKSNQKPLSLEEMPAPLRSSLDDLAGSLLNMDVTRTIIYGEPLSGKTFLIKQFAFNSEHYLAKTSHGPLHFIHLNDVQMIELKSSEELKKYANDIFTELKVQPHNLCFMTESPEIAIYISSVLKDCKIILEINTDTFAKIVESAQNSTSKMWNSWDVISVDSILFTLEELSSLLEKTILEEVNALYQEKMTKTNIINFVKTTIKKYPEIIKKIGKTEKILVPAGIWAVMIRVLATNLAYSSSEKYKTNKGSVSFSKMVTKTLEDCDTSIEQFLGEEESTADKMVNILSDELGETFGTLIASTNTAPIQKKQKDKEKFEFNNISTLANRLKKTIFGEDEAVDRVARGFLVPAAGLNDPTKPIRSLLFLGPTGVGKTQLSLDLANELGKKGMMNVVRIDMSEYQESHEVAKLFGAPPGYIGYDKGGVLTSAVAENPQSLILLDEIEKAHPKVYDVFLQVLDSGRMTDSQGNEIDFTQTVIIMTSNIGASEASKLRAGFSHGSEEDLRRARIKEGELIVKKELERSFRPEFLNRIDDIVIFKEISQDTARAIANREISLIALRMENSKYKFSKISQNVLQLILEKSDIGRYGAREIQRIVFKNISSPAAEIIVQNPGGGTINISTLDNEIVVLRANQKVKN